MTEPTYQDKLAAEADLWGAESERVAQAVPPDWRSHRHLRHNVIMHAADIDAFLAHVQPGMTAVELGCASGWLTLAMAQRGAQATGLDISERSLAVARAYADSIRAELPGRVEYRAADLNALELPAETYDVVAVKSVLHHLVHMDHAIAQIHRALKPGGLLWVSDAHGDEATATVLIAGALALLLPTEISYGDKLRSLARFGLRAPGRVKASIQAEGLSPFEGAGREHDWLKLIGERFEIVQQAYAPAFTGYITAQLRAREAVAVPLLKTMRAADRLLVRLRVLRSTGVILYARKPR